VTDLGDGGQAYGQFSGVLENNGLPSPGGFCAQRTVTGRPEYDLSGYDALVVNIFSSDDCLYTLVLEDQIAVPQGEDPRLEHNIIWEQEFIAPTTRRFSTRAVLDFEKFKPTFRGKVVEGVPHLDLRHIQRIAVMIRGFGRLSRLRPSLLVGLETNACTGMTICNQVLSV
jgi:Complex I intermediate-associated protein 30 (CIA30)